MRFRNESIFTEIFLKRFKGERRGKDRFRLVACGCYLWGAPASPLGRPEREHGHFQKLSLAAQHHALYMVMQPYPTIRWSRLTDPKVELEPEIDPSPPGGSRTLLACPSQA